MNYELAKKLKDAGFPMPLSAIDERVREAFGENGKVYLFPTLSELIEACGKDFGMLINMSSDNKQKFEAYSDTDYGPSPSGLKGNGATPEEAVANLWLALNKK